MASQATRHLPTKEKTVLCKLASNTTPNASQISKVEVEKLLPGRPVRSGYRMYVGQRDSREREHSP